MTILSDIAAYKREEVARAKVLMPLAQLEAEARNVDAPRGFLSALMGARSKKQFGLIAEIKKASPSKGLIRANFDPEELAKSYEAGGATCLSVLTDTPSFQGAPEYLKRARRAATLPVLRKDFILDTYQVVEARVWGADCALIILAMVDDILASELVAVAGQWNMDVLVEIHNERELERAIKLNAELIGINNRDLKTFATDLGVTLRLAPMIPAETLAVAESGLSTAADLEQLAEVGVTTFLIGESLMREADVAAATARLIGAIVRP
ncbi:MAG TPA: indole-3-glycerol phosphate synthase TrpC [Rhizomicrobium sp.]|jgi:indole-3-glycerol phosphate synthase|nr:indole-3-glycerol phosphate synthase TrpC [Rhizomicrobium sp.]